MSGPTPTLPSSGSHSIVRVNSALPSSPQDINPSQSATLNFYGNAPLRRSNSQGRARPGSVDNSAPRARKTSAPSSTAASAPFNAFAAPPVPTSTRSQTHAGGILPPASFFRPTRPAAVIQPATPGSPSRRPVAPYGSPPPASITVRPSSPPPPENISTAPPQRQQSANDSLASTQPLARQLTSGSEGSGTFGINTGTAPSSEGHSRNPSITTSVTSPNNPYGPKPKAEQSRERLLPIGEKSTRSLVSDTTPTATTALPNNVRKSFDRIFFKRQASTGRESAPGQTPVTTTYPPDAQTLPHLSNIPQSPDTPTFSPDQRRPGSRHPHFAPTPRVSASIENHSDGHDHSSLPPGYALIPTPSGKPARNWMFHPANNRFMFKGRFITGSGDSPLPFLFTLAVVLAIAGTWLGATVPWWWHNKSPAVGIIGGYLCLLTLTSMAMTVFRDPGILPRNVDIDPPYPAVTPEDGERMALPRDLRVRSGTVRVKYCTTCKTYRPPRSSHCRMCNNCVDGADHHCQWLNNCVGRRNYTFFITFLVTATITVYFAIITSALHLYFLSRDNHIGAKQAISKAPGSAALFIMTLLVVWPAMALLSYHIRLLLLNVTTIEQVRNQAHQSFVPGPTPPNPFALGKWHRNLGYLLCRPAGYSWIEPWGLATEDRREVNPGFGRDSCPWKGGLDVERDRTEASQGTSPLTPNTQYGRTPMAVRDADIEMSVAERHL